MIVASVRTEECHSSIPKWETLWRSRFSHFQLTDYELFARESRLQIPIRCRKRIVQRRTNYRERIASHLECRRMRHSIDALSEAANYDDAILDKGFR